MGWAVGGAGKDGIASSEAVEAVFFALLGGMLAMMDFCMMFCPCDYPIPRYVLAMLDVRDAIKTKTKARHKLRGSGRAAAADPASRSNSHA